MPTVEEVVSGLGLQYLGAVDAPDPILVPPAVLIRIQHWDREQAACAARKQELMEMAVDLLGIDRVAVFPTIDLDTGVVTLTPREVPAS